MDFIGIDVHKQESQVRMLAAEGEVVEKRIQTESPWLCRAASPAFQLRHTLPGHTLLSASHGVLVSPGRPGNSGCSRPSRLPLLDRMCPQCAPLARN